jgi:hypothetical protein
MRFGRFSDQASLPIRGGIEHAASGNVKLAIVIKIPNAAAFATKHIVEMSPFEFDLIGRRGRFGFQEGWLARQNYMCIYENQ